MDLSQRAQHLSTDFERQLTDLARAMAEQVVAAAVAAANEVAQRMLTDRGAYSERDATARSSRSRPSPPRRPSPPSSSPAASQLRPSAPAPGSPETPVEPPSPRPRAEKRKPGERSDLRERIVQCVQRQPGLSVEELNRALGTTTEEVQPPLRMLLTRGVLRVEGELTTARYFPQTRGWAASTPPRR